MSDNLDKCSFKDLFKQRKIRIPKIQRDYVQGRQNRKVNEIRKVFVHTLLLVVKGKRPETELDFIYGSNHNNAFEPLDGQQRLTTLFLLYWIMGESLVSDDKKHSVFTYETRNTSSEFCDEIVHHDAWQFISEALRNKDYNKSVNESGEKKPEIPSLIIKNRDWFKWEWRYDPTIQSMLVMIDAIYSEMGSDWKQDLSVYRENLEHVTFNLLNLGDFGLSDELFIKMNARGKQLSDFDKLKSTLEEELQIQQKEINEKGESLVSGEIEELWRTLMDGAWIDLFWHKYARQTMIKYADGKSVDDKNLCLRSAKLTETYFKRLLLRLIALQLFENDIVSAKLSEAAYNLEETRLDNLLFLYEDSLTDLRSDEKHVVDQGKVFILDFKRLIEDMNLLIYKTNDNIYHEVSDLLPEDTHINKDKQTLFESFLKPKVPNDVDLIFYAMLLFLRAFPMQKKRFDNEGLMSWYFEENCHSAWLDNFGEWIRLMRNILLNDNNNQRIDRIQFSKEATRSLKKLIADFAGFVKTENLSIEHDSTLVTQFLDSSNQTYTRLDNQSLAEERLKARLMLEINDGDDWKKEIRKAESHHYLWGQIRCLLNWADNVNKFSEYSKRLLQLLDFIKENGLIYYSAMLAFKPDCWKDSNRLFQYNKDRDNSFKRYLRDKDGQVYGACIKELLDYWMCNYSGFSVEDFLNALRRVKEKDAASWVQCIIKCPSILDESVYKRLYKENGHVIIPHLKTRDSHCFDPLFVYFRNVCKARHLDDTAYKLYDSKGDYKHGFELNTGDQKYLIRWSEQPNRYTLQIDNPKCVEEYDPAEIVDYFDEVISAHCIS